MDSSSDMSQPEKREGGREKELLNHLRSWRDEEARREGVEPYRVMPNATLDALVERMPKNTSELLEVKGIKEAKSRRYGKMLLGILNEFSREEGVERIDGRGQRSDGEGSTAETGYRKSIGESQEALPASDHLFSNSDHLSSATLSVSQFLDGINVELSGMAARVRGEVSSVSRTGKAVYFSLKDGEDGSVLNCVIFQFHYAVSGIDLAEGDEVIVEGFPEVYKPYGKFNLRVSIIEYAGEGALKKAYDALLKKLESEGLFAPERKRAIPKFAERIALITSADGAAIGDFTTNLGRNGLCIDFYPTAVEGKRAVLEIIAAIKFFNQTPEHYACIVMVRGGGSLESLQAFNTEALVHEVAHSRIPVLAGVGHERDVTLAALAADKMVSTPTAAAKFLALPWDEARVTVRHAREVLFDRFEKDVREKTFDLRRSATVLSSCFSRLLTSYRGLEQDFLRSGSTFPLLLRQVRENFEASARGLMQAFSQSFQLANDGLRQSEQALRRHNPERLLALGYSLVRSRGALVRSVKGLQRGERLDIQMSDGAVQSEVKEIRGNV